MATTGAGKLGFAAVLEYMSGGNYASPTFTPLTCVSDLALKTAWDKGEAQTRFSRVKMQAKTMMGLSITAKIRSSNAGDAAYTAVVAALAGDTVVTVQCLNGPASTNGVWGFMFDSQLFQADEDLGLGSEVCDDVEFMPYPSGNQPQYALVTSGAVVYTAF